jgi:hypothetical protein
MAWAYWCTEGGTYTTSSTASTTTAWSSWCDYSTAATTTAASGDVWITWNTSGTNASATTMPVSVRRAAIPERTPEQIAADQAAQRRREAEWKAERDKREAEAKAAEARATKLLKENLDDEQRKELASHKRFHVVGSDGERYEVDCTKRQHNVFAVKDGKRVREFCAVQTGDTPLQDHLLAQKLMLEADADAFKRVANKWDLVPHRRQVV